MSSEYYGVTREKCFRCEKTHRGRKYPKSIVFPFFPRTGEWSPPVETFCFDCREDILCSFQEFACSTENSVEWVYFLKMKGTRKFKIGFVSNGKDGIANRIRVLQTGNPAPLELVARMPGGISQEHLLHKILKDLRIRGEWFQGDKSLNEFVRSVRRVNLCWESVLNEGRYDAPFAVEYNRRHFTYPSILCFQESRKKVRAKSQKTTSASSQ